MAGELRKLDNAARLQQPQAHQPGTQSGVQNNATQANPTASPLQARALGTGASFNTDFSQMASAEPVHTQTEAAPAAAAKDAQLSFVRALQTQYRDIEDSFYDTNAEQGVFGRFVDGVKNNTGLKGHNGSNATREKVHALGAKLSALHDAVNTGALSGEEWTRRMDDIAKTAGYDSADALAEGLGQSAQMTQIANFEASQKTGKNIVYGVGTLAIAATGIGAVGLAAAGTFGVAAAGVATAVTGTLGTTGTAVAAGALSGGLAAPGLREIEDASGGEAFNAIGADGLIEAGKGAAQGAMIGFAGAKLAHLGLKTRLVTEGVGVGAGFGATDYMAEVARDEDLDWNTGDFAKTVAVSAAFNTLFVGAGAALGKGFGGKGANPVTPPGPSPSGGASDVARGVGARFKSAGKWVRSHMPGQGEAATGDAVGGVGARARATAAKAKKWAGNYAPGRKGGAPDDVIDVVQGDDGVFRPNPSRTQRVRAAAAHPLKAAGASARRGKKAAGGVWEKFQSWFGRGKATAPDAPSAIITPPPAADTPVGLLPSPKPNTPAPAVDAPASAVDAPAPAVDAPAASSSASALTEVPAAPAAGQPAVSSPPAAPAASSSPATSLRARLSTLRDRFSTWRAARAANAKAGQPAAGGAPAPATGAVPTVDIPAPASVARAHRPALLWTGNGGLTPEGASLVGPAVRPAGRTSTSAAADSTVSVKVPTEAPYNLKDEIRAALNRVKIERETDSTYAQRAAQIERETTRIQTEIAQAYADRDAGIEAAWRQADAQQDRALRTALRAEARRSAAELRAQTRREVAGFSPDAENLGNSTPVAQLAEETDAAYAELAQQQADRLAELRRQGRQEARQAERALRVQTSREIAGFAPNADNTLVSVGRVGQERLITDQNAGTARQFLYNRPNFQRDLAELQQNLDVTGPVTAQQVQNLLDDSALALPIEEAIRVRIRLKDLTGDDLAKYAGALDMMLRYALS